MKYKCYFEAQVWILRRRIVVLPPLSLFFVASMALSFISLICPLWDLFMCPLLGSFICVLFAIFSSLLRTTLYIYKDEQGQHSFTR